MRVHLCAGLLVGLSIAGPAVAAPLPAPPCAAQTVPNYPRLGDAPHVTLWTKADLGTGWKPPSCTPWPDGAANIVVGLAGHFHDDGGADTLLTRIGAISALTGVRYWSVTEGQWNAMFTRAVALSGPDPKKRRGDFTPAEMRGGTNLYFVAADLRSGKDAVSRLRVLSADSDHLILETENVTPLRWTFLTYAAPENFQTWYFLDRDAGRDWRFYSLTRVFYASSLFGSVIPDKSYINRAVAMYRHFSGQSTDRDPPAAP